MSAKREAGERFSLSRWSRRKLEAAPAAPVPAATTPAPASAAATAPATPVEVPLPPVESLTFDSDFTAFLRPGVDAQLKRAALKQLFRDPRFNVMDGLDTYIDDYTKADPIPPDMLAGLLQRFGSAPDATAAPAVVSSEGVVPSPASGGEGAQAERSAGEAVAPSPAGGAANEQATRSPGDESASHERRDAVPIGAKRIEGR